MITDLQDAPVPMARKILASLATIAAAAGLMALGTFGTFDNSNDPFPHAVVVHGE